MAVTSTRHFGLRPIPAHAPEAGNASPPAGMRSPRTSTAQISGTGPVPPADREVRCLMAGVELRATWARAPACWSVRRRLRRLPVRTWASSARRSPAGGVPAIIKQRRPGPEEPRPATISWAAPSGTLRMDRGRPGPPRRDRPPRHPARPRHRPGSAAATWTAMSFSFIIGRSDSWERRSIGPSSASTRPLRRRARRLSRVHPDTAAAMRSLEEHRPVTPAPAQPTAFDPTRLVTSNSASKSSSSACCPFPRSESYHAQSL